MELTHAINKLFFLHHRQKQPLSSSQYLSFSNNRGGLAVARAKKKNNKKRDKSDSHSYIGRADESLGFFPEAVLLQKKAVKVESQTLPEFADEGEEKLYQALSLQLESDLNLERMRHYEVIFLIHEKHDEVVEEVVTKVEDYIREKKGRIWRVNDWGLRRLAYRIKKAYNAHYILMNFEMDAKFINDFKTMLDKEERVIRHLTTKADKAETETEPPPMEYHTLLAQQGFKFDDEDEEEEEEEEEGEEGEEGYDGNLMYGGGFDDEEEYEGGDGEVIYVDGDE
ncbi:hypothetical protein LUZ60_015846 [Juncus effusus]|nr:hypothetical protein LUZ60_015846 [Juncus effusus]